MDNLYIDFETFYSPQFNLTKLNYTSYIRADTFKIHGLGIALNDAEPIWISNNISETLASFDWANITLIAQNMMFDGFILHQHFNIHPARYMDTLAMSRALHQGAIPNDLDSLAKAYKLGEKLPDLKETYGLQTLSPELEAKLARYCLNDVNLTRKLYKLFVPNFPDAELELIHITSRLFCNPLLELDQELAEQALRHEQEKLDNAVTNSGLSLKQLRSDKQFAQALAQYTKVPTKISPKKGVAYAFAKTDLEFQNLATHPQAEVRNLYQGRRAAKSSNLLTKIQRFLDAGSNNQKLPIALNYYGGHTGRWSGANKMNPQAINRGSDLRKSILAPETSVICVADSSQIECRVIGDTAGENALVEPFREKRDIYAEFAKELFNLDRELDHKNNKQDEILRFIGKVCILGLGFGLGWRTLQRYLALAAMGGPPIYITDEESQKYVSIYRNKFQRIPELWRRAEDWLLCLYTNRTASYKMLEIGDSRIHLPNGMYLYYPGLHLDETGFSYISGGTPTKIWGGLVVENVVQALARIIIAHQMLQIDPLYPVVSMTHDEIAVLAFEHEADKALQKLLSTMTHDKPSWAKQIPLAAEGKHARHYPK